jgi:hypothetical protein
MSSNSAASSASATPDTGSAKPEEYINFFVDISWDSITKHCAKEGVIFEGYYDDNPVLVTYLTSPTNLPEDHSEHHTTIRMYAVCVRIDDPTNPSESFTADGTLHCRTYIFCEDESEEEGIPNYSAWIEVCHPITKKRVFIDYPRNIR